MGRSIVQIRIPRPIPDGLTVFETMRAGADGVIALWPRHLARLMRGCAAVGFACDMARIAGALADVPRGSVTRLRLAVAADGQVSVIHAPLPPNPQIWNVAFSTLCLNSDDPWLTIKSSQRGVYDAARAALPHGIDEAILCNERGQICEGTITNLFLRDGDLLLTPPRSCGLLPGVLRQSLLDAGRAREAMLSANDLRMAPILMGNALRGLIPARFMD